MTTGLVREPFGQAAVRDESNDNKSRGFKKYISPWQSIDASAAYVFRHEIGIVPHVVSVIQATDSQGTGQTEATSISFASTPTTVTVTNSGAARFFRVRAF